MKNPYIKFVGSPIQEIVGFNTMILSGIASKQQWTENQPLSQKQAKELWQYMKRRYCTHFSERSAGDHERARPNHPVQKSLWIRAHQSVPNDSSIQLCASTEIGTTD